MEDQASLRPVTLNRISHAEVTNENVASTEISEAELNSLLRARQTEQEFDEFIDELITMEPEEAIAKLRVLFDAAARNPKFWPSANYVTKGLFEAKDVPAETLQYIEERFIVMKFREPNSIYVAYDALNDFTIKYQKTMAPIELYKRVTNELVLSQRNDEALRALNFGTKACASHPHVFELWEHKSKLLKDIRSRERAAAKKRNRMRRSKKWITPATKSQGWAY